MTTTNGKPDIGELRMAHTVAEVADILGVSRPTVYNVVAQGQLKAHKLGRRTIILHSELERFVANLPELELQ